MKITATQYAKSLYELTTNKSEKDINVVVSNFFKTLAKNRQIKLAKKIVESFGNIWNKERGIVEAEVTTKEKVSTEVYTKVSTYVKDKYKAKEVIIKNKIDSNIKGGIVIKVGDEIMDGSVARQLQDLKNNLVK